MKWLDNLLFGLRTIFADGSALPDRPAMNIHGTGVTVTDDEAHNRYDVEIGAGGMISWSAITASAVGATAPLVIGNGWAISATKLELGTATPGIAGEFTRDASGRLRAYVGGPQRVPVMGDIAIPLLARLTPTTAAAGTPEEVGGYWLDVSSFAWATTAKLRVYLRTTNGTHAAKAGLYDGDAALAAAPAAVGSPASSTSTVGELVEVDVSGLLTNAGGSGAGWLQLRAWSEGGTAVVGRADLVIS